MLGAEARGAGGRGFWEGEYGGFGEICPVCVWVKLRREHWEGRSVRWGCTGVEVVEGLDHGWVFGVVEAMGKDCANRFAPGVFGHKRANLLEQVFRQRLR